jgi:uncharacterized protein (TIGR02246 family)
MRINLWSMKTRLSLFAIVVVSLVLFEHVRGVETNSHSTRVAPAAPRNLRLASLEKAESGPVASGRKVSERAAGEGAVSDDNVSGNAASDSADVAIRKTAEAFTAAFDRGDAAAIAALWTVDGEYLDGEGNRFAGRGAIERQYARFFAEHPDARIEIVIDAIRPIGADAAIEDGHASLLPRVPGEPQSSPYTVIHAKVEGQWLMASVREPRALQQSQTADPLASLDWLVGSWRAEQNGGRMDVAYRWIANHSFLERTYSVEQGGRVTASGVQLIGRDPSSEELQSWSFTSDAGLAVGNWIPQPNGWTIATRGKLPDGTTTGAVNYLTRVDANTLSWQSRERKSGGVSLPDTEAVRLTRDVPSR